MEQNTDRQVSLTEKAYQEIKKWIIRYDVKPGTSLRIAQLSAQLEMSQTPVREALSKLEREHLIERLSNQGYVVRSMDVEEVEDIYNVRAALETMAAEEAATRVTEAILTELAHILEEAADLMSKGEKGRTLDLEQKFHTVIMVASGNHFLTEIGRGILERIWMIQNVNIFTSDHMTLAHREHIEILEALKNRDPQKAATLMKNHLRFAKEFVVSRLKDNNDFLGRLLMGFPDSRWAA